MSKKKKYTCLWWNYNMVLSQFTIIRKKEWCVCVCESISVYPEDSILMRAEELANIEKGFNRHSISTIVAVGFVTIAMGLWGAGVWQAGVLSWQSNINLTLPWVEQISSKKVYLIERQFPRRKDRSQQRLVGTASQHTAIRRPASHLLLHLIKGPHYGSLVVVLWI